MTRSAVAFLRGDLASSFHAHPFGPLLFVVALAWALTRLARRRGMHVIELPERWRNAAVTLAAVSWMIWWPAHAW
jgi:hypothetical protein